MADDAPDRSHFAETSAAALRRLDLYKAEFLKILSTETFDDGESKEVQVLNHDQVSSPRALNQSCSIIAFFSTSLRTLGKLSRSL